MQPLIDLIKKCVDKDPADLSGFLSYLVEEVGEVSTCIAVENGFKKKTPKETVEQEGCDVLICMLALMVKRNPKLKAKDVQNYMEKKIARWASRL